MTRFFLTGALAMAMITTAQAQEREIVPVADEIGVDEVLGLLDCANPALAPVCAARQAGDRERALVLLVQHFATRTQPVLPPTEFPGIGVGNSTTVLGSRTSREVADSTWMKHVFTLSNNDTGKQETHALGAEITWMENPSSALSWVLYLNQLNHLNGLAALYQASGHEPYAIEVGESLVSWTRQCPRWYGYTNKGAITASPMEVRNRLCNLVAAYEVLRRSPSLSVEMHLAFWQTVIACCRELSTYRGVSYPGLIPAAVLFPEFSESASWFAAGEANLRVSLVDRTSPDGAWDTHSIAYQTVPVPWAARVLEILRANPQRAGQAEMAEMVQTQVGKLLGILLWITMPNGGMPNIGDTYGRGDWSSGVVKSKLDAFIASQLPPEQQAHLQAVPTVFERVCRTLALVTGAAGDVPKATSVAFPASGYYAMRSSWMPMDPLYAFFDLSPQGQGHAHNDATHLELYAYGKPLLVDTGDYFLGWGYRTALHNAVEVDGQQQARGDKAPMMPVEWLSSTGFDLVDGAHGAYEDKGVSHRRRVLFVKPDYLLLTDLLNGDETHTYEQFFHFAGPTQLDPAVADIDPQSLAAQTRHDGVANVLLAPVHTDGLSAAFAVAQDTEMKPENKQDREAMLGWLVTDGTFRRVKSAVAVYTRDGAGPQAFHTVLFPIPAHAEAEVQVEPLPVWEGNVPVAPAATVGLRLHVTLRAPTHDLASLQPRTGTNLALGCPASAGVSRGSIAATSPLLTDGDPAAAKLGGGPASTPYLANEPLEGSFAVDLGQAQEINAVKVHHGIWNGSGIIYPAAELSVQTWSGAEWQPVQRAATTWHDDLVSLTCFAPVQTGQVRVMVSRPAGGRIAAREVEVFRIPDAELHRVEQARNERTVTRWTDHILLAHEGAGMRRYGAIEFAGELAFWRENEAGMRTRLMVKGGRELRLDNALVFAAPEPLDYLDATWEGETLAIECPVTPAGLQVSAGAARQVVLNGTAWEHWQSRDGMLSFPDAEGTAPRITGLRVDLQPPQPGMAAAQPSAVISWNTDRPATSQVRFREPGGILQRSLLDATLKTTHRITAHFLRPGRTYQVVAESVDEVGRRVSLAADAAGQAPGAGEP